MAILKNNTEMNEESKLNAKYFEYMSLLCTSNLHFFNGDNTDWTTDTNVIDFFMKVDEFFLIVITCNILQYNHAGSAKFYPHSKKLHVGRPTMSK